MPVTEEIPSSSSPSLADILTSRLPRGTIYHDYIRDSLTLSTLLTAPTGFTTLVVPTNQALIRLARKPHQGPEGAPVVYANGREEEDAKREYLEKWMKRHVVPGEVEEESEQVYQSLVEGNTVSFEMNQEGQRVVLPGEIPVVDVIKASNGKIILIDGTLALQE